VELVFQIDREGRLEMSRVTRSSGTPGLDEAALQMLKEASPFPKLPDSVPGIGYKATLPVAYSLR